MSINRKAKARDANEKEIIQALKQIGCDVYIEETGDFDLLVGYKDIFATIEVKMPNGRLKENQRRFIEHNVSKGRRSGVAYTVEDAFRIIGHDFKI